ncbi:MAG: cupin domain-containing protein [Woeseiaceae bacterium]
MINNLDIQDFISHYWQKKPLLIRSAFPNYQSPVSAEELAGLACEDFVESRIIQENTTKPKWSLSNGPFVENDFTSLPDSHWTVLIQNINFLYPELDDILREFNFIPSWRVDDLMASYASPNGSVGPHLDQYDVFLLQAQGRRKWIINDDTNKNYQFEKDTSLKIIKDFTATDEWILEAGDMLYLPANVAHHGIGMDDCMTFSIGFRAPSHAELLSSFVDDHMPKLEDNIRYQDEGLSINNENGEISATAINQIQETLISQFSDRNRIEKWFGKFITGYHIDSEQLNDSDMSIDDFKKQLPNKVLRRPANVRANYIINEKSELSLFINGEDFNVTNVNLAKLFCNQHLYNNTNLCEYLTESINIDFLYHLYTSGYIEFTDE